MGYGMEEMSNEQLLAYFEQRFEDLEEAREQLEEFELSAVQQVRLEAMKYLGFPVLENQYDFNRVQSCVDYILNGSR
jgi:hypothetical protein